MVPLGTLVFDLDGTLFRSDTVTVPAVRHAFLAEGLTPPPPDAIRWFFGKPHEQFQEWLGSLVPPRCAARIVREVDRLELELVAARGELYPGVLDMLRAARRRFACLAICSNGEEGYVMRVVESTGLVPFFDRVRFRVRDTDDKTSMLAELLLLCPSRPVFMIGDRAEDIEAARRNGIVAIAASYGYGTVGELAAADATVQSPRALLEVLSFLMLGSRRVSDCLDPSLP